MYKGFIKAFMFSIGFLLVCSALSAAGFPVSKAINFVVDLFMKSLG